MTAAQFGTYIGYLLGILILFVTAKICAAPLKLILKLILSSVLGCSLLLLVNLIFAGTGFHVGINPVTALCTGILGIPGAALIIVLQLML